MTARDERIRDVDVERAVEAVRALEAPTALAALCLDVLGRFAEGKTAFAGKKLIEGRAEEHGVERDAAATDAGNVLAILERGADTALERALIGALAVRGLEAEDAPDGFERFVRHADWLELSSAFRVYPFVDPLLGDDAAATTWREVGRAIEAEGRGDPGADPLARARNATRASALAGSRSSVASEVLRAVLATPELDPPTRELIRELAGVGARSDLPVVAPRVTGRIGRAPRGDVREVVRWVSGFALAAWVLRAIGYLLGVRREAEIRLADRGLELESVTRLLGRAVRQRTERWSLGSIRGAGREVRYPALHLLVGAVALSGGVLFGGVVLLDGLRSGELVLVCIAASLVFGGASLDLLLDVLVPARRGRVAIDVAVGTDHTVRVVGVSLEEADRFLRALAGRLR